ncbi:AMP-binding protein [Paenalcaligenes sp.]|uniref:AMP-binding protein n=1 Tax=Paenalcaligenes sp. TaxID=1966342 RepID=UPI0026095B6C|nr:AMP-binding protein [Paenalcaligenes sp.]
MEKIWLKSYPEDVPETISTSGYTSLVDVLEQSCERFAKQTAYVSLGREMSYAELNRQSSYFANWLRLQGFKKGDAVLLMMPNILQYMVCMFGVLKAGCVMVNCNPLYKPRELEYQLNDSQAKAIVVAENFAHVLEKVKHRPYLQSVVVTGVGDLLGAVKGGLTNFVLRRVKKAVPKWTLPGHVRLKQALRLGSRQSYQPVNIQQDDLAFLQYTGGTTGVPKSAMLSHGNMLANLMQAYTWVREVVRDGKECVITALPLYHIFALTANCMLFIKLGARNVLIPDARDIPALIKTMNKEKMTGFTGVNTLFNALLNHPDFAKVDFSSLRLVLGGGMAVQKAVSERWEKVTGLPLVQAYGLTETSPAVTINPFDGRHVEGSIGLPLPSTELVIRDDSGQNMGVGEVGEICVRGPQVTSGYWQKPEETAQVFYADGFLRTGDIGYIDANGFVFLVDRKKDIILVSGFNVYPNEIEEVVAMHPGVQEVAAVGVPDERTGEAVKLFVQRKDPNLTERELIKYCRQHLTGYKIPHYVEFRDELPKSNVGKILRKALR